MTPAPKKNPAAVETAGLEIAVQRQREGSADPSKREPTTAAGAVAKAAPIPADVKLIAGALVLPVHKTLHPDQVDALYAGIIRAILADRASQEERIREDEREALFLAAERAKRRHIRSWIGMRGGMFPADRARQRGDAS